MKKDTRDIVLEATRKVVSNKGSECSLREIGIVADVSYAHLHRSYPAKEQLLKDTEEYLYTLLKESIGEGSDSETLSVLLVKVWFALQNVSHSRAFLLKILSPDYPDFQLVNPLVARLQKVCGKMFSGGLFASSQDPRLLASTVYMISLMGDPALLLRLCSMFEVPCNPDELSIKYLNAMTGNLHSISKL